MPRLCVPFVGLILLPTASFAEDPLRAVIDHELAVAWKKQDIEPAAKSTDAEFLRRVYLDLVGTIPTHNETKQFLADTDPKKREKLIDKLLADARFATAQANVWDLVLFSRDPGNISATRDRPEFQQWLAKQFANNVPFDKLVRELLLAEQPDSAMFLVQFRNAPEEAAVKVSRLFLGVQMQCARCHDHPYDVWTQKDFYGVAGFFVRLVVEQTKSGKKQMYTIGEKSTGEVLFSGTAADQTPGKRGEPVKPKFLGGAVLDEPELPKDFKEPTPKSGEKLPPPRFSRKAKFAEWVANDENPYLARAAVNRMWSQFMGRGIVHPVDDFHEQNYASHPELLKTLAEQFVAHKFDMKWLIREIVNSDAYQLSGVGPSTEATPEWFERARVRPLTAEELMAAMRVATAYDINGDTTAKLPTSADAYFLRAFGEPTNGRGEFQGGLTEHLFLNNSGQVRSLIRHKKGNLADQILTSSDPWEQRVTRIFLSVLNREPKPQELEAFVSYIGREEKPDDAVEDAIWVLLNSSEFRFNH